ncbi:hypothetical protein TSAR_006696 [Trichomalopsis sarcophagae]|uniref:DPY30 domain-containing protein 2 n=1 Tax=Trichomalopsis sarcophagae TaxID=543379 RepID=A0A232F0L9_9HYME|nr:hypothetical protein TSAR_006696 [Trichomalopsis sarcophagae]
MSSESADKAKYKHSRDFPKQNRNDRASIELRTPAIASIRNVPTPHVYNVSSSSLHPHTRDVHICIGIQSSAAGRSERSISETDVSSAGAYLSRHLSAILPAALSEIALKKPVDPVEYLGQWLLHYRECEDRERRRREFEAELIEERLKLPRDETLVVIADDYREDQCEDSTSFDC